MNKVKKKILLVEDEPDIRATINSYLGRRGFIIKSTASGQQALAIVGEFKPDLVLLDFMLQELDGREALGKLRELDQNTKVIIITGEILADEEIEKIKLMGVSDYLQKPISLENLANKIYDVLGAKKVKVVNRDLSKSNAKVGNSDSHELLNLLGVIKNKCENYVLNIKDEVYQNKNEKEIIEISVELMKGVIRSADQAAEVVKRSNTKGK